MPNHLILWKEMSLFMGTNQRPILEHQHPMAQLVIADQGHFFWKNPEGQWKEKQNLLIGPNQKHECDARNQAVLIVNIDPETSFGEFLEQTYQLSEGLKSLPEKKIQEFLEQGLHALVEEKNWAELYHLILGLFDFSPSYSFSPQTDERISRTVDFIKTNLQSDLSLQSLLDTAHLSESRLMHLFKEEMGLPIRNYIQWERIQLAFQHILQGHKLTEAAYYAGFADQAHLSRTVVKHYGIPPSAIVKNSRFVQVSIPD